MQKRMLTIEADGNRITGGSCSNCGAKYKVPPEIQSDSEAARLHLREQFNKHNCNEDASQAAVRIVREPTKDK